MARRNVLDTDQLLRTFELETCLVLCTIEVVETMFSGRGSVIPFFMIVSLYYSNTTIVHR